MPEQKSRISYPLLLGDLIFYLALFVFAVTRGHGPTRLFGSVVAIPSFALWFMAKLQLGRSFKLRAEACSLVTRGLYSKIRHPIYFFSSLALLGTAICLHYLYFYIYVAITVVVQLWRIGREEKVLQQTFGEAYLEYKRYNWF